MTESKFMYELEKAQALKNALEKIFVDLFDGKRKFKIAVNWDCLMDEWCIYVDVFQKKENETPKLIHSEWKHFDIESFESIDFLKICKEIQENIEKAFTTNTFNPLGYLQDQKFKEAVTQRQNVTP